MPDQEERVSQPFPEEALTEAIIVQKRIAAVLKERPEANGITINDPLTQACDMAFWLERTPGGYTLFVSMVDVASFISEHTTPALDREARMRAFVHHTPEKIFLPLLPESLAEVSLSLLEGHPCPTLTLLSLPLDATYHVGEPSFQQTYVRSRKRFTYEEADQERADTAAPFSLLFQDAYHVALRLWHVRLQQGAATSYDLENGWVMTEDGVRILLDTDTRYKAYIIEQEFLILANHTTIASFLATAELPALYRNHAVEVPPTKATYGSNISGHGGLNVPVYVHALFPLRRYPDLINQRILLANVRGGVHRADEATPRSPIYTGRLGLDFPLHMTARGFHVGLEVSFPPCYTRC